METLRKPLAYLLCLLGLILTVQFIAFPIYSDAVSFQLAWDIWGYINGGTAIGTAIALFVSFQRWRGYDRSDVRQSVAAGAMFMFSGAFAIMFVEQTLSARLLVEEGEVVPDYRGMVWVAVDVLFPVLMAWVASYLLRNE